MALSMPFVAQYLEDDRNLKTAVEYARTHEDQFVGMSGKAITLPFNGIRIRRDDNHMRWDFEFLDEDGKVRKQVWCNDEMMMELTTVTMPKDLKEDDSMKVFEYVVCNMNNDGERVEIFRNGSLLANTLEEAKLIVAGDLGASKVKIQEVDIQVRPFR